MNERDLFRRVAERQLPSKEQMWQSIEQKKRRKRPNRPNRWQKRIVAAGIVLLFFLASTNDTLAQSMRQLPGVQTVLQWFTVTEVSESTAGVVTTRSAQVNDEQWNEMNDWLKQRSAAERSHLEREAAYFYEAYEVDEANGRTLDPIIQSHDIHLTYATDEWVSFYETTKETLVGETYTFVTPQTIDRRTKRPVPVEALLGERARAIIDEAIVRWVHAKEKTVPHSIDYYERYYEGKEVTKDASIPYYVDEHGVVTIVFQASELIRLDEGVQHVPIAPIPTDD